MPAFFPNITAPLPRATRTTSLSGKPYSGGYAGKPDALTEWEGFRTFRDPRSPTGWIDTVGHVIGGVTTAGVPLLMGKDGKLYYNPASHHGGLFGKLVGLYTGGLATSFVQSAESSAFGNQVTGLATALAPKVADMVIPGLGKIVAEGQAIEGEISGDPGQTPPAPQGHVQGPDVHANIPVSSSTEILALIAAVVAVVLIARS